MDEDEEAGYLTLRQLRKAAGLTQVEVAHRMGLTQQRLAAIELSDPRHILVTTLDRFITATGGTLHIYVEFDNGDRFPILGKLPE